MPNLLYGESVIYIDESGDLGWTPRRGSDFFIIVALKTNEDGKIERIPKNVRKKFDSKKDKSTEFKSNNSRSEIKKYVLNEVIKTDSQIFWCAINKKNTQEDIRKNKDELYNYVCGEVLKKTFLCCQSNKIQLTLDKRSSRHIPKLNGYIEDIFSCHYIGYFPPKLRISHYGSNNSGGLQVVDFVAGAIFKSVERGDDEYIT